MCARLWRLPSKAIACSSAKSLTRAIAMAQLSVKTWPFGYCFVPAIGTVSTCLLLHASCSQPCHHVAVAIAAYTEQCRPVCPDPVTVRKPVSLQPPCVKSGSVVTQTCVLQSAGTHLASGHTRY